MFGTMTVSPTDLSDEEKDRYREIYCGLCHALKDRGGERCRTCLTYDLTFLVMLYHSLYEPDEEHEEERCFMSPHKRHAYSLSKYTNYAADLSIALAYHKLDDNWRDDHALTSHAGTMLLEKSYQKTCERIPEQCEAIEQACNEMYELEQTPHTPPDAVANCFGQLLVQLFVFEKDVWEEPLSQMAHALGRFIYFMDAVVDYEDNIKSGSYNPLIAHNISLETASDALFDFMGEATQAFEKLPLDQDLHLLRSVLYGGVWNLYCKKLGLDEQIMGCAEECDTTESLQASDTSQATLVYEEV